MIPGAHQPVAQPGRVVHVVPPGVPVRQHRAAARAAAARTPPRARWSTACSSCCSPTRPRSARPRRVQHVVPAGRRRVPTPIPSSRCSTSTTTQQPGVRRRRVGAGRGVPRAWKTPRSIREIGLELRLEAQVGDLTPARHHRPARARRRRRARRHRLQDRPRARHASTSRAGSAGVHFYSFLCESVLGSGPAAIRLMYLRTGETITAMPSAQSVRFITTRTTAVWKAVEQACTHRRLPAPAGRAVRVVRVPAVVPGVRRRPRHWPPSRRRSRSVASPPHDTVRLTARSRCRSLRWADRCVRRARRRSARAPARPPRRRPVCPRWPASSATSA